MQKRNISEKMRGEIKDSIEESYQHFAPLGPDYTNILHKRQRCGEYFTTEDIKSTEELISKKKEEEQKRHLHQCIDASLETERWCKLQHAWAKHRRMPQEPPVEASGVFRVSQFFNKKYDTFDEFVCIESSAGAARFHHPGGGCAFVYEKSDLERNEEWLRDGNLGPAPLWYLGSGNSWVHGAFVHVERISDYNPPTGSKHTYGIVTSSFRSG